MSIFEWVKRLFRSVCNEDIILLDEDEQLHLEMVYDMEQYDDNIE